VATKTNLHENTITKGIKELISKKLIKEFKTAKNPTKRMYVLFHLEPTEDSTGGNFYREGELDEGLVSTLSTFIVAQVENKSWVEQTNGLVEEVGEARKRNRTNKDVPRSTFKTMKSLNGYPLVPHPPSFADYPTVEDVLDMIDEAELLKDLTLSLDDVRQLIQQLIYDDRLEEMSGGRYRSVRRVWTEQFSQPEGGVNLGPGPFELDDEGFGPGNGLSQAPCGRCPVADECRVGGVISPENCEYMQKWLDY
jgi:DNA-directed RNA polymerase III subunit RPC6